MKYVLLFDGASSMAHDGTYGVVIRSGHDISADDNTASPDKSFGHYHADIHGTIADRKATCNEAEYEGLIAGLEHIANNAKDPVVLGDELVVRGDSQLIIKQMTGEYSVKAPNLVPLHGKAMELVGVLESRGIAVSFEWIPREANKSADDISRP